MFEVICITVTISKLLKISFKKYWIHNEFTHFYLFYTPKSSINSFIVNVSIMTVLRGAEFFFWIFIRIKGILISIIRQSKHPRFLSFASCLLIWNNLFVNNKGLFKIHDREMILKSTTVIVNDKSSWQYYNKNHHYK